MRAALLFVVLSVVALGCDEMPESVLIDQKYPCSSNADCAEGFVCAVVAGQVDAKLCQSACQRSSDCADPEQVCNHEGACVPWRSPVCQVIEGPYRDDNVVFIGSIGPTSIIGYDEDQLAVAMAVEQVNENGGLPNGAKLVMVGCDDGEDREQAEAAARHLVHTIGVPAIIGPSYSGIFMQVAEQVTVPAGVLLISPSATSPFITDLQDNGLAWRTVASDVVQSEALGVLASVLGCQKIAALVKKDAYGDGLLGGVSTVLSTMVDDRSFLPFTYPEAELDAERFVADAYAPGFQCVMLLGTAEAADLMLAWESRAAQQGESPRYILSEGGKVQALFDALASQPQIQSRVIGTDPALRNGSIFSAFSSRFVGQYQRQILAFGANAYDAAYVVVLAMCAVAQGEPLSGAAIAQAIGRLTSGELVELRPENYASARARLANGESIDIEGTSGSLAFDLATGDTRSGLIAWGVSGSGSEMKAEQVGVFVPAPLGLGSWLLN
ncbi:MAG: ABC transporter substrate-binding protein [Myxococcota bacterium]|jgi:branched-chain amino acid transport system substrate-binding protein|nr:ABC transporter substrate-binding protein [Myxococcota bacterium]